MTEITFRQALQRGLREALDADPDVFLMGEDIGKYDGAYAVTQGLLEKYGPERIRDTPISEAAFVGAGVGAAVAGLRPVVELMSMSFSLVAMDQIVNMAAKIRYMSGGQVKVPMVLRAPTGGGVQLGATHSQSFENWYASTPGLKVVTPSTPYDALGLLRSSIEDDNPVVFAEHALLYGVRGEVPDEEYRVPIGVADIKRSGTDITMVGWAHGIVTLLDAAEKLSETGVSAEVVDLRTLRPLDMDTVVESVEKTGRALVLDENWRTGGFGAEIAAEIGYRCSDYMDGPVARVGGADAPAPYSRPLEQLGIPQTSWVIDEIEKIYGL
ncbi:MAG: alpha-ketoacid dehydrogenase subunit beta [Chloroflexi bacterium]|nr:alpha-ketoacid dehydrogenase subunit beta [Chloroflexota bacterium]